MSGIAFGHRDEDLLGILVEPSNAQVE